MKFWKPRTVKIILLAESHVFISNDDYHVLFNNLLDGLIEIEYLNNFTGFVYCLGY